MPPSNSSFPRPPRPRSASPAERSVEFAEAQKRLKQEAADRRAGVKTAPEATPGDTPPADPPAAA